MLCHDSELAPLQPAIMMHVMVDGSVGDLMELISLQGDMKAQRRPG